MPPLNQTPTSPPISGQGQYDFFLNPPAGQKRPLFNASDAKTRYLIIGTAVMVLIIAIIVISSLLGGGGNLLPAITVAQDQTELARVAAEGSNQAVQQTTLNLAETTNLSLTSSQSQWVSYLAAAGHQLSPTQLSATKNLKTDQELTAAAADSNYDSVFVNVMQSELAGYIRDIQAAYPTVGPKGKTLLKNDFQGAKLLAQQAAAAASALQNG